MSFLGLLERKATVPVTKKEGNMQMYCLNDDCGLKNTKRLQEEAGSTRGREGAPRGFDLLGVFVN